MHESESARFVDWALPEVQKSIWKQFLFKVLYNYVILTVFRIYQELVTFMVTRPTTMSSSEEKDLDQNTFPEISVCLNPSLKNYLWTGIKQISTVFRGSIDGNKFVGWNWMVGEKNISENANNIMTMKLDQQYFLNVFYTLLFYIRGRCILFQIGHFSAFLA